MIFPWRAVIFGLINQWGRCATLVQDRKKNVSLLSTQILLLFFQLRTYPLFTDAGTQVRIPTRPGRASLGSVQAG